MKAEWLFSLPFVLLAGCGNPMRQLPSEVQAALEAPDALQVLKVDELADPFGEKEKIGHYGILKSTTVTHSNQPQVADWLRNEVLDQKKGMNKCFDPHDAIRVKKGRVTYDLVICVTCGGMQIYRKGKRIGYVPTHTGAVPPEKALAFLKL